MLKLENVSKIYYTNGIVATGISKVNLELNIGEGRVSSRVRT